MNSREKILSVVKKNQPTASSLLPDLNIPSSVKNDIEKFKTILVNIGGAVIEADGYAQIQDHINKNFSGKRIVSTISDLSLSIDFKTDPHLLENVNLAILQGQFAVAENGAVWITAEAMGDRALPFITEHLALVVNRENILATMHDAYDKIGTSDYNYGTFIAGPSKTADIEQSLVLGAHGAKSLIVFLMH
jgi:L-lactate dehydrogenase complex protein LldG